MLSLVIKFDFFTVEFFKVVLSFLIKNSLSPIFSQILFCSKWFFNYFGNLLIIKSHHSFRFLLSNFLPTSPLDSRLLPRPPLLAAHSTFTSSNYLHNSSSCTPAHFSVLLFLLFTLPSSRVRFLFTEPLAALRHQTWKHFFSAELDKRVAEWNLLRRSGINGSTKSPTVLHSLKCQQGQKGSKALGKNKAYFSTLAPPPQRPRSTTNKIGSKDLDSFSSVTPLFLLQSVTKTWETTKFDGNSSFGKLRGICLSHCSRKLTGVTKKPCQHRWTRVFSFD